MNLDEKKKFIINFTYFLLWITTIYLVFKVAAGYLFPFLIGIVIAYFVQKPAWYISKKTKFSKQISAAILSFFLYVFVFLFFILLFWLIYTQSNRVFNSTLLSEMINGLLDKIMTFLNNNLNDSENVTINKIANETVDGFIQKISMYLSKIVADFIKKIPSFIISGSITIVATCYISKDFDRLYMFIRGLISERTYKKFLTIKSIFVECFLKFTFGYLKLFLITFIVLLAGLFMLNISNFVFVALLISFVDLLPVFGTGAVLLPWATLEILQYNYSKGIGLIILYLVITVVKNFIEPKIIGNQIDINPLFTLIFIFLGLKLGGVIGMIILPIILTVCFNYFRQKIHLSE